MGAGARLHKLIVTISIIANANHRVADVAGPFGLNYAIKKSKSVTRITSR
jgi:hypothetical protein